MHLRVAGLSDEDGVPSSSKSHRYRWYESSEPEVQSSWSLISGAEGASFRVGSGQAGKYLARCFFLHGLRRDTGACICAKRGGCSSQEFAFCCGSDIRRGEGEQFFERVCFRGGGGSGDGFAQFESGTREAFVDEEQAGLGEWCSVLAASSHFRFLRCCLSLACNLRARRGVGCKLRAHKRKVRLHSRAVAHRRSLPRNLRALRGVGRKFRRARKHKVRARSKATAHRHNPPLNLEARRGVGRKFRRAHNHKVRVRGKATAHRRSPPLNLEARRGVGRKFRRAHNHKVRARGKATAHRRSLPRNLQARRGVQHKFRRAHKCKVRAHSKATAHRRNLPLNLQTRRGVGCKFPRAHKRKVRARSKATAHRRSSLCHRIPPRSLMLPHSKISPSSKVPTRRPNLHKEPQSRSLQRMQQNRKSAEMHQSRERRRGS